MRILWKDGAIGRPFFGLAFVTLAWLLAFGGFCFFSDPYDLCKSSDLARYFSLAGLPRLRLEGSSLMDVAEPAGFGEDELTSPDCILRGLPLATGFIVDRADVLLLTLLMV